MSLVEQTEKLPLQEDHDGVIRVGGTRVTLDSVVAAFEEGATAEEIVQQYPTLRLADVYSVLGFYLRHREEVEAYLKQAQEQALAVRRENEQRHPPAGIRERLLSRQHPESSASS